MKAAVIQNNNQIAADLFGLMKLKKTNLTQICKKYDLDYQTYYRSMHSTLIPLDWLQAFCRLIDPEIQIDFRVNSVSLEMEIFYTPS